MLKQLLLIGVGGGAGSMLRYLTSVLTARFFHGQFPMATFAANLLGCLLIGVFTGYVMRNAWHPDLRFLLITGFCGGYTTFSTFALENISLWQAQHYITLVTYVLLSVLAGLAAVLIGIRISGG